MSSSPPPLLTLPLELHYQILALPTILTTCSQTSLALVCRPWRDVVKRLGARIVLVRDYGGVESSASNGNEEGTLNDWNDGDDYGDDDDKWNWDSNQNTGWGWEGYWNEPQDQEEKNKNRKKNPAPTLKPKIHNSKATSLYTFFHQQPDLIGCMTSFLWSYTSSYFSDSDYGNGYDPYQPLSYILPKASGLKELRIACDWRFILYPPSSPSIPHHNPRYLPPLHPLSRLTHLDLVHGGDEKKTVFENQYRNQSLNMNHSHHKRINLSTAIPYLTPNTTISTPITPTSSSYSSSSLSSLKFLTLTNFDLSFPPRVQKQSQSLSSPKFSFAEERATETLPLASFSLTALCVVHCSCFPSHSHLNPKNDPAAKITVTQTLLSLFYNSKPSLKGLQIFAMDGEESDEGEGRFRELGEGLLGWFSNKPDCHALLSFQNEKEETGGKGDEEREEEEGGFKNENETVNSKNEVNNDGDADTKLTIKATIPLIHLELAYTTTHILETYLPHFPNLQILELYPDLPSTTTTPSSPIPLSLFSNLPPSINSFSYASNPSDLIPILSNQSLLPNLKKLRLANEIKPSSSSNNDLGNRSGIRYPAHLDPILRLCSQRSPISVIPFFSDSLGWRRRRRKVDELDDDDGGRSELGCCCWCLCEVHRRERGISKALWGGDKFNRNGRLGCQFCLAVMGGLKRDE